ncbi:helix-turn-helix domain-containing protein (plasmid) [Haloimpatiens sp. FM7330]|uniref:helix-turn-helix domain-containing protein n=1 Tax=Haloimpatiens sp. FM7330 TaxID=3298610 RepID=UPI00363EEC0B
MTLFKDRFKKLRLEKKLTLKELGQKLGYSESTMSMYESGKRQPKKAEDFVKIANFFEVSTDYLLGKSDPTTSNSKTSRDLSKEFIDLLIEHKKIKSKEDLTAEKLFSILNDIFKKGTD